MRNMGGGVLWTLEGADKVLHGLYREEPLNWVSSISGEQQDRGQPEQGLGYREADQLPLKRRQDRDLSNKEQAQVTPWLPFSVSSFRMRNLLGISAIRNHRPIKRKRPFNKGVSPRAKQPWRKDTFPGLCYSNTGKCDAGGGSQGQVYTGREL